jgi:hypothetical protein
MPVRPSLATRKTSPGLTAPLYVSGSTDSLAPTQRVITLL